MRGRSVTLAAGLIATAISPSVAHEFWLEPSSFDPPAGSHVSLAFRAGEAFEGSPVPRDDTRIVLFESSAAPGALIPGRHASDPAGLLRVVTDEPFVVIYESDHRRIELDADRFEAYLASEGLERVIADRAARGESDGPGRERYARCAKTLLVPRTGEPAAVAGRQPDAALGLTFELVAENDPATLPPGTPLTFRLLFRGTPVDGALVKAWRRGGPATPLAARTDSDGRVSMDLDEGGAWLVSAVHMIRTPGRLDAEWESWWASLTFRRGPAGD